MLMQRRQRRPLADESAQFGHLGDHHRHHFQRIDLVGGKFPRLARLYHQHAQGFAQPLDRDAEERGIALFAGLRHVAETGLGRRVGGVDHAPGLGDAAHQPLAQAHAGAMHRLGLQTLGRAKLQRVGIAEQVDRADLGPHTVRDQVGDLVQAGLTGIAAGHDLAQPP